MNLILVGPGRAGLALSLRLVDAGHSIAGVLARDDDAAAEAASRLGSQRLAWGSDLPSTDLMLIAVSDDSITEVAGRLAPAVSDIDAVVHLSGSVSVAALGTLDGPMLGSFHPLQTLPTPETGAARLEGAWAGVTTNEDFLADRLFALATSIGMYPFELDDGAKPLYHAAAAAAANYPLAALAMAEQIFEAAGVPLEAAEPLVMAAVANAFSMGPRAALTGPIARGDVETVRGQLVAIEREVPGLVAHFRALGRATATVAATTEAMDEVLR